MKTYILALHAGHNASACIGDESGLLYAIQEERVVREKNYWGFPKESLKACLKYVNATPADISKIAYGGKLVLSRYHSRDDVMESYNRQTTLSGKLRQRFVMPLAITLMPDYGQDTLKKDLSEAGFGDVPVEHYDHHFSHAATAYYGLRESPEKPTLVVTCDGAGDHLCTTVGIWGNGKYEKVASTPWTDSLGALYSWVTWRMGFVPLEHEYKLMGMAPYAAGGAGDDIRDLFKSYLWLDDSGLAFKRRTFARINDLGERMTTDLTGKRFDYICAGLQNFTEDLLTAWITNCIEKPGVRDVLAAGGVFMNVKANKRIAEIPGLESFQAFPSCGDETLPFGAYWIAAAEEYGDKNVPALPNCYLADDLDDEETQAAIKASGLHFSKPDNIAESVAELLAAGHPVARCAGRMEFGARALGNRSILGDPKNPDLVRIINQMVKKRDFWMPFAPMVKAERQADYIQNPKKLRSPYMMMTFATCPETCGDIMAAVHNADLTCRAQILEQEHNPQMHAILSAFEEKTGGRWLPTQAETSVPPRLQTAKWVEVVFGEATNVAFMSSSA